MFFQWIEKKNGLDHGLDVISKKNDLKPNNMILCGHLMIIQTGQELSSILCSLDLGMRDFINCNINALKTK